MKIDFEFQTEFGSFSDSIHLPEDHGLTKEEIEAMKQSRFDAWYLNLTTPILSDNIGVDNQQLGDV